MHRANKGLPPIIKRNTKKQTEFLQRCKLIDYFKEKTSEIHGTSYFTHQMDREQAKKANSQIGKQLKEFYNRCDKDIKKAKEVIDWFVTSESFRAKESNYSPTVCFTIKTVVEYENKKSNKNNWF